MKVLIFDSSTLISLAMNGLLEEFRRLKANFKGQFIIPKEVKEEIIDKPIQRKVFELEALKLKQLVDDKILESPKTLGVDEDKITQEAKKLTDTANDLFQDHGTSVKIISMGEASCLALSKILRERNIENLVCVDERTTRMLVEKPENLQKLLLKKLHIKVKLRKKNFEMFKGFKIIRSSELVYLLYKKNLINLKDSRTLDALLYAVKFKGCAISQEEIEEIKQIK